MVDSRVCSKCAESRPVAGFSGRSGHCKKCVADYNRAYYRANKAALQAQQKEYRKRYYAENREQILAKHRKYREANRDDVLAKKRAYYAANRPRLLQEARAHQAANAERYRGYVRDWRINNPEKLGALLRARRARKLNASGSHTEKDWQRMLRIWNWSCAYCGSSAGRLTRDHVIPLSRGGSDFIGNIVPACARCNSSKNARFIMEWAGAA